ncbi:MAG: hypothetical protein EBR82_11960 [Caulobacteraceae bacterium]|nr:hypothetical protein [Caulobacteraceae bacterium]
MALDPVTALLDIGGKVIDRIWPDPAQAASAKFELFKLQQSGELQQIAGQLEINKIEAASTSVFVSGWRPFIGWVCGTACAWNWIGLKIALFASAYFGHTLDLAPADLSEMMPVLMGMLGIGGLRTIEKINGVAAK